jgi:hypothetical protein
LACGYSLRLRLRFVVRSGVVRPRAFTHGFFGSFCCGTSVLGRPPSRFLVASFVFAVQYWRSRSGLTPVAQCARLLAAQGPFRAALLSWGVNAATVYVAIFASGGSVLLLCFQGASRGRKKAAVFGGRFAPPKTPPFQGGFCAPTPASLSAFSRSGNARIKNRLTV